MNADASPFFFCHIQKTGGTTLKRRLIRHFGRSAVYPDDSDSDGDIVSAVISVDRLVERWQARRGEIRVVTGHFPLAAAELLGGDFTTVTVLREPVTRTLSYLRHHRTLTPADADLGLEAVYDDPFRYEGLIRNHMVRMLSLTPAEMTDGALSRVEYGPERLARAKANLASVDVVGLTERFDDFCADLTTRFGWDLGEPLVANRTDDREPVSDELRARIAADNADDVELYEFATSLVASRSAGS